MHENASRSIAPVDFQAVFPRRDHTIAAVAALQRLGTPGALPLVDKFSGGPSTITCQSRFPPRSGPLEKIP